MKVTIGGDFCITPSFLQSDMFEIEIIRLFQQSDLNIINLECPVTEDNMNYKILKTGPYIRTDETIAKHLKSINVHAVTLANNHLLDYGEVGLKSTLEFCIKNNIKYVGAGLNLKDASEPLFFKHDEITIAIVNFCESEWSIATPFKGGANQMDLIDNLAQIKNAKKLADLVFVIVHGGHEYYHLPSPRMVKQYRFYAENGADAVIGHHTHCISGYEVYNEVPIFYSLGNFLFTLKSNNTVWYTGLICQFTIKKDKIIKYELYPIQQSYDTHKLFLLEGEARDIIFSSVKQFCEIIKNENSLFNEWNNFISVKRENINILSPVNILPGRYLKAAIGRLGFHNLLLTNSFLKSILNHIRCEAHKDIIIELLTKRISKQ